MATEVMTFQKTEASAELWMIITEIHWISFNLFYWVQLILQEIFIVKWITGDISINYVTVWTWRGFLADLEMYAQNIQAQVIARFTQISKGKLCLQIDIFVFMQKMFRGTLKVWLAVYLGVAKRVLRKLSL